jgi:hypothetical protein
MPVPTLFKEEKYFIFILVGLEIRREKKALPPTECPTFPL